METESKRWKLGDDVSAEDNILDGFTFKDLILAVHCNCESITPEAVRREAAEILEERMQDYRFLLRNNIEEIMAEAKKGRAQYAQHYLFGVPEERDLKKDDLVLVRNSRGEVPAVCVCDSFSVPENVLEQLQKMYGGKTLKWVIGSVEFLRWEQEKEEAK